MNLETESVQRCSHSHCGSLLTVHADGKCLDTTQKEEAVEWGESIADRVDDECYLLQVLSMNSSDRTVELKTHLGKVVIVAGNYACH